MTAYKIAIQRLVNHDWNGSFDLPLILAVIRGPDEAKYDKLKETHTAPLRLYLLGREAYNKAGYFPVASRVTKVLPEIHNIDHFTGHISRS